MTATERDGDVLLQRVRRVAVGEPGPGDAAPVDVRVRRGVVTEVAPGLRPSSGEHVVDGDGRWLLPGLWDAHVHFAQWARNLDRLDVSGAAGPDEALARVAAHLAEHGHDGRTVVGYGHRPATWSQPPTVAALDAVCGDRPVVLVSGDAHHGWLSTAALRLLGLPPRDGIVEEAEWFAVFARLDELPGQADPADTAHRASAAAAAHGVVGIGDMELEAGHLAWPARVASGVDLLRVRTATYADGLDARLASGLRTGDPVPGTGGLVTAGPLKVIFDGSVGTRTAWCCAPYAGSGGADGWRGVLNLTVEELTGLCARAHAHGVQVAVHAIGDAAVTAALDAVERSGAAGSLEHVQLLRCEDAPRFAALGVRASVQPAHLLDDRDVTAQLWPDPQHRSFALRTLLDAGADVRLGSDAPVAPLDPWLAMAAAVHRTADARPPWAPEESLTAAEALAASTDGQGTVRPGSPGDLVLLDDDPLRPCADSAETAAQLRSVRVAATWVGGRCTWSAL